MPTTEGPANAHSGSDTKFDAIGVLFREAPRNLDLVSKDSYIDEIHRAIGLFLSGFRVGGKLLVGSSGDAQHICGELVGRFLKRRQALPAIAKAK